MDEGESKEMNGKPSLEDSVDSLKELLIKHSGALDALVANAEEIAKSTKGTSTSEVMTSLAASLMTIRTSCIAMRVLLAIQTREIKAVLQTKKELAKQRKQVVEIRKQIATRNKRIIIATKANKDALTAINEWMKKHEPLMKELVDERNIRDRHISRGEKSKA